MALTHAAMTTLIVTKLQSSGSVDYSVAEVTSQIIEGLKEFAHYQPHTVPTLMQIESRRGTASTASASNLVDTTKDQFLTTDATNEKVVYNTHDHTWAVITSVASTSSVGISRDIFAINENYRIYNKRCTNEKQLYIGDVPDYTSIEAVEYPIGVRRNWKILNDILEIDVDTVRDSDASSSKTYLPDVDVMVRWARPHILTILPTYTGYVAATVAASVTTISGSALPAGTIRTGDEFYLENMRNLYTVTTGTTVAANTGVFSFYPPLETNIGSTAAATITFTQSTLQPNQEDIFADLVAARLAISKPMKLYSQANSAIVTIATAATSVSNMSAQLSLAATALTAGATELDKTVALVTAANSVIVDVEAMVLLAQTAMTTGATLINVIGVTANPDTDWINSAQGELAVASGLLNSANGFFSQAQMDESIGGAYGQQAAGNVLLAAQHLQQASGYFQQVSSQLSVSNAGRNLENWGHNKLVETLGRLRSDTKPRKSVRWPTEL